MFFLRQRKISCFSSLKETFLVHCIISFFINMLYFYSFQSFYFYLLIHMFDYFCYITLLFWWQILCSIVWSHGLWYLFLFFIFVFVSRSDKITASFVFRLTPSSVHVACYHIVSGFELSFPFLSFSIVWFVLGLYPVMLRVYPWLCAQVSFLAIVKGHMWCWELNLGWLYTKQIPYLLFCFSGSETELYA